ncbi:hypothetical protein ACP4OV_014893 [Aristida adscensionis]
MDGGGGCDLVGRKIGQGYCGIQFHLQRERMGVWSLDWSSLDQDVVQLIGWRVLAGDLLDYVRFRAVCKHWSSSTLRPGGRGLLDPRFRPRRWMMLPEGHGLYPGHPDLNGDVRFFNLSTGAFARAHLPLLSDHVVLDSVDGLLLLHRDHDTAVRLLHPFTGDVADLPPLHSLLPQIKRHTYFSNSKRSAIRRVRAAVAAVSATGTITVMLAFEFLHRVAYATTGDRRWILSHWQFLPFLRPVAFQGRFYSFDIPFRKKRLYIYQIDPPRQDATTEGRPHQPLPEKIVECSLERIDTPVYLVECGSELLVVGYNDLSKKILGYNDFFYRCMVAYRVDDLARGNIVPMTSIGDYSLFLHDRCLCVSPNKSLPSISNNSIITLPSWISNHDVEPKVPKACLGEYDLGTGTWSLASHEVEDSVEGPLLGPSTLLHHIYSCCCPEYWNKGMLICTKTKPDWPVKSDLRFGVSKRNHRLCSKPVWLGIEEGGGGVLGGTSGGRGLAVHVLREEAPWAWRCTTLEYAAGALILAAHHPHKDTTTCDEVAGACGLSACGRGGNQHDTDEVVIDLKVVALVTVKVFGTICIEEHIGVLGSKAIRGEWLLFLLLAR